MAAPAWPAVSFKRKRDMVEPARAEFLPKIRHHGIIEHQVGGWKVLHEVEQLTNADTNVVRPMLQALAR